MTPPVLFPRLLLAACLSLLMVSSVMGCRASECQKMSKCCEAVADVDGVGLSCKNLADATKDPTTCRDVMRTVGYMYEDRDESLPEACRMNNPG